MFISITDDIHDNPSLMQFLKSTFNAMGVAARVWRKQKCIFLVLVLLVTYFVFILRASIQSRQDQTEIDLADWMKRPYAACGGNFTGYGHEFARLQNARLSEKDVFSLPCVGKLPEYTFLFGKEGTPLNGWVYNLKRLQASELSSADNDVIEAPTVAVMRYEAHNIYHTMTDWYNVFLVCKLLNLDPKRVNILFMDDRPPGLMDETWDVLFGKIMRHTEVKPNVIFRDLIWNILGYESPVNFHRLTRLPFVEEFHHLFVNSFGVNSLKKLDCSNLTAVVIWRRDYMTHPERQTEVAGGLVHRKFKNEAEILSTINSVLEGHTVKAVVLEEMGMKEQLSLFTKTDMLIGMHGAGMAHTMFLPPHAAVFETFPNYWGFLLHFKAFSRWRGLIYLGWQNNDAANEFPDFYTSIPADVVRSHIQQLKDYLCK